MSGILGFICDRPQTVRPDRVRGALRLLEYRGLDDQGILVLNASMSARLFLNQITEGSSDAAHWSNGLATALLACCGAPAQDHSPSGNQAADSPGGQIFLAFDGLIDNAQDLNQELRQFGCNMRSACKLGVILAALEQWGPDCLSRITGSFAFAALDLHRRRLILARDAFGTRPLYYARPNGAGLYFSSHIGALLELASVTRSVNRASLYRYLAYNTMEHGAETFFAGIEQVSPGYYLEVPLDKPTQLAPTRSRPVTPVGTKFTFEETAEYVRELVTKAVVAQVGNHTAVGTAFSGGFDSSFVAGAFERANPGVQLTLYNCVPVLKKGEFSQSEEAWAHLAAEGLRAPLKKVRVSAANLPDVFSMLIKLHEQPFSSPVVFAQLQVFRAAQSDGIKLMLSGQGGDTIFAPSSDQLLRAVLAQIRRRAWNDAGALLRASSRLLDHNILRLGAAAARLVWPQTLQTFLRRRHRAAARDWLRDEWFGVDHLVPEGQLGLPMLRFEDRNSVACSILNRMPLLTTELHDFVGSLPPEFLIRPDQPMKSLEVAAMRGIVPDAILERKERTGFPVPVREWLYELDPWVEGNIEELERFPFLEARRVRQIWENVRSKGESASEAFLVWRWVFLAGWVRFFDVRWD